MPNKLFVLAVAVVIVLLVFRLLRSRALREKYAALWILVGLGTVVLAAFPGLLNQATTLLGFTVPSNLLFVISTLLLLAVSLQLSHEISVLEDETRVLAEESAIHRLTIARLHARLETLEKRAVDEGPPRSARDETARLARPDPVERASRPESVWSRREDVPRERPQ
ncbi:DUF2304 domain-containing protein [Brachybacterium huguangmaarense]|uniref:DUF2304 domain-containing protein n=1 Tax=Brachybacterium huguangmaarense TaxID=1652028 RepID=A0ABY6G408_9MICO|nr:DUF2304 domain-containing protein [Brachybacterium huguangmaarense]UYG17933.1 DUF2304 domain-containing protein [Brachybacterium huguangmaarense]